MRNTKRTFWLTIFAWFLTLIALANATMFVSFSFRINILQRNARQLWQITQKNLLHQSLNWLEPYFTLPPAEAETKIIEWIQTGKTEFTGHFGLFREDVLVFICHEEWNVLYHGLPVQGFYPSIETTPDKRWLNFIEAIHTEPDGSLVLQWLPVQEDILLTWASFNIQKTTYHLVISTPVQTIYTWNRIQDIVQWKNISFLLGNSILLLWVIIMSWILQHQEKKRLQAKKEVETQQSLIRQYQQALKTVQKELDSLTQHATSKDEFLMNMSHELRSPLNTILGMTDALQESALGAIPSEEDKKLAIIHESGLHLLSVFNDILDLAKVESGKMVLEKAPFSIQSLCESCVRIIQPVASKKSIPLHLTIDPALKGMAADETRVRQILLNLLNNAVKFGIQGKAIQFDVVPSQHQPAVSFIIRNQGETIPYEKTVEIFQPFVQLNNTLSRKYQGTGLGLVLVLKLVMAHHGSITLLSEDNQTSFQVTLPMNILPEIERSTDHPQILFYTENRFYEEWLRDRDIPNLFLTRQLESLRGADLATYSHLFLELPFLLEPHLQLISDLSRTLDKTAQHLIVVLSVWHPRWEQELKKAGCVEYYVHPFDMNAYLTAITPAKEE